MAAGPGANLWSVVVCVAIGTSTTTQVAGRAVWDLAGRQHGVVTRAQLLKLGLSAGAIRHRLKKGRLHPVWRGVYAVGTPRLSQLGEWMAAVLSCGPGSVLSHHPAAALWGFRHSIAGFVHVTTEFPRRRQVATEIRLHRSTTLGPEDRTARRGIPVTRPARTLIDLAAVLPANEIEAALKECDQLDLLHLPGLLDCLARLRAQPGTRAVRALVDKRTFRLTGFRVDFHWPDLGLVVETDGGRWHRTAEKQRRDARRDRTHTLAQAIALRRDRRSA